MSALLNNKDYMINLWSIHTSLGENGLLYLLVSHLTLWHYGDKDILYRNHASLIDEKIMSHRTEKAHFEDILTKVTVSK